MSGCSPRWMKTASGRVASEHSLSPQHSALSTIFAGVPHERVLTKMDENSEYASGRVASEHSLSPQSSALSTIFVGDQHERQDSGS